MRHNKQFINTPTQVLVHISLSR